MANAMFQLFFFASASQAATMFLAPSSVRTLVSLSWARAVEVAARRRRAVENSIRFMTDLWRKGGNEKGGKGRSSTAPRITRVAPYRPVQLRLVSTALLPTDLYSLSC